MDDPHAVRKPIWRAWASPPSFRLPAHIGGGGVVGAVLSLFVGGRAAMPLAMVGFLLAGGIADQYWRDSHAPSEDWHLPPTTRRTGRALIAVGIVLLAAAVLIAALT